GTRKGRVLYRNDETLSFQGIARALCNRFSVPHPALNVRHQFPGSLEHFFLGETILFAANGEPLALRHLPNLAYQAIRTQNWKGEWHAICHSETERSCSGKGQCADSHRRGPGAGRKTSARMHHDRADHALRLAAGLAGKSRKRGAEVALNPKQLGAPVERP